MIVKMTKYDIVLFAAEREQFIERLRDIGLVDITTTGWEPAEADRQLLADIESRQKALDFLTAFAASVDYTASAPRAEGSAYAAYTATQADIATAKSEIARLTKVVDEWSGWGDFSVDTIKRLADAGVHLRYFTTQKSTFDKNEAEWSAQYTITLISTVDSIARFVVIGDGDVAIDAQEQKAPAMSVSEAEQAMRDQIATLRRLNTALSACADARNEIAEELATLKMQLQDVRIGATAEQAADGMLLVMEGWAAKETSAQVDAVLDNCPHVIYIKSEPTPQDDTPVQLKNNWFARIFEFVGNMYALPKYGTIDLTPFFAPFYMLFFGICLNDAGYGLILLVLGLAVRNHVCRFDNFVRLFLRLVLRNEHAGVVPFGAFLRFPRQILLCRLGYRHSADTLRHGTENRTHLPNRRCETLALGTRLVYRSALGKFGGRSADVRCNDSVFHRIVARILRSSRVGFGTYAAVQLTGQEHICQYRCRLVGDLQQHHRHFERRVELHPTLRHRSVGRCAGIGVQLACRRFRA